MPTDLQCVCERLAAQAQCKALYAYMHVRNDKSSISLQDVRLSGHCLVRSAHLPLITNHRRSIFTRFCRKIYPHAQKALC